MPLILCWPGVERDLVAAVEMLLPWQNLVMWQSQISINIVMYNYGFFSCFSIVLNGQDDPNILYSMTLWTSVALLNRCHGVGFVLWTMSTILGRIPNPKKHKLMLIVAYMKYVGLIWSPFLIKYLYLRGIWESLQVRMDTKKTCDVIGMCAQSIDTILGSIMNIIGQAYKIV